MAKKNIEFSKRLEKLIGGPSGNSPIKKEFAKNSGIKYSSLMTYLSKNDPGRVASWENLVKIAKYTGKTIDWLLTGEDEKPGKKVIDIADPDHLNIINRFEDKKWAREQNETLLEIEKRAPERKTAAATALNNVLIGPGPLVIDDADEKPGSCILKKR